ncbi:MAG TPA: thioredoxin family protein [Flavitalea sp.]|nr:thioredoxin family protein [Flavitalea sp.]
MKPYSVLFVVLSFFLVKQMVAQQSPKQANEVLQEAYRQAATDNKNVFLMFHASWCGWCHKLDSSINDKTVSDFFNNSYVITHLIVYESKDKKNLENPGALELLGKYKGNDLGIPYWIIFDKNGKWLADSQMRQEGADFNVLGENVGCPASREEVNHFLKVLAKTSSLNANQLSVVEKRFLLNK